MKTIQILLVALFATTQVQAQGIMLAGGAVEAEPAPEIPTDNLIVHIDAGNSTSYPGTGNTWYDLSGNDNHMTLYNNPTYDSENGLFDFNGVNQYAYRTGGMSQANYTIGVWIKINPSASTSYVAGNYDNSSSQRKGAFISVVTSPDYTYRVISRGNSNDDAVIELYTSEYLNTTDWYFLSVTRSGNTVKGYFNGVEFFTNSTISTDNSGDLFEIAKLTGSTGYGALKASQAFYYSKALSAQEMLDLYNATNRY